MSIPESVRAAALSAVSAYCEVRVPEFVRAQVRVSYSFQGDAITLVEHRPPWDGSDRAWTETRIAKITWDEATATWSLSWADREGRWLTLPELPPVGDIAIALATIDSNPNGCFWG